MRMYEQWSSREMLSARTRADERLRKYERHELKGESIQNESKELWIELGMVKHFMGDLNQMIEHEVVDPDLSFKLFHVVLRGWFELLDHVDWRGDTEWEREFAHAIASLESKMRSECPDNQNTLA